MPSSIEQHGTFEDRPALYYPYIHIRSENWLKSALLAFQQVKRIVPGGFSLRDQDVIAPYAQLIAVDDQPLLVAAPIQTEFVDNVQRSLYERLREHQAALRRMYSRAITPDHYKMGEEAFQLNRHKLLNEAFTDWLIENQLAWDSRGRGDFQWLTMHPRLGSAIMTALGLAVAKENGLNVVTPSTRTHDNLLANSEKGILAAVLRVPISLDDPVGAKPSAQELCQLILTMTFDLTRLKSTDIRDMIREGKGELRKFYNHLIHFSENIPADIGREERFRRLRDKADEVIADWRRCAAKLPQLKDAVREAASDKGPEKAFNALKDLLKEGVKAYSLSHVFGIEGLIVSIALKAGSHMLRKHDNSLQLPQPRREKGRRQHRITIRAPMEQADRLGCFSHHQVHLNSCPE